MEIEDSLTTLRIILSPVIMALILTNEATAAFYLYLVAAITDLFDGYFARKSKKHSEKGDVFDTLADLTLVYLTVFALGVARQSTATIVVMIVTLALVVYPLGMLSMKKKALTIPHFKSAKVLAWCFNPTIMAYIISWEHADTMFVITLIVGIYTAIDYIAYAIKQKTL
jgi:phosphatidylglycerophosphate synthase